MNVLTAIANLEYISHILLVSPLITLNIKTSKNSLSFPVTCFSKTFKSEKIWVTGGQKVLKIYGLITNYCFLNSDWLFKCRKPIKAQEAVICDWL